MKIYFAANSDDNLLHIESKKISFSYLSVCGYILLTFFNLINAFGYYLLPFGIIYQVKVIDFNFM